MQKQQHQLQKDKLHGEFRTRDTKITTFYLVFKATLTWELRLTLSTSYTDFESRKITS